MCEASVAIEITEMSEILTKVEPDAKIVPLLKKKPKKIAFDDVMTAVGTFGPYQWKIYLLFCLPLVSNSFQSMAGEFLAAKPDFRCLLPHESPENATYQLSQNLTNILYPWRDETEGWPKCERYDVQFTDQCYVVDGNLSSTNSTAKCEHFVYDKTTYELTVTTEFNLVCDASWLRVAADSLFMVGMLLGAMIFGGLSDRYGRKPTLCLILFIQTIVGFLIALAPEIISYLVLRLLIASTVNGTYMVSFVSAVEMVVPAKRWMVGFGIGMASTIGYVLTPAFAYFITNWRLLQIAITIPNIVFFMYWWLIPECARWLVTAGRLAEAEDGIQRACSANGIELPRDKLSQMLNNCSIGNPSSEESSVLDLLRYRNMRRKSLLLFVNWFIIIATYYGLSWNTFSLAGDVYLNFAISGLVEIPANIFILFTLNKWGRRSILSASMIIAGISLLLTIFVPDDVSWLTVVLTMFGKLSISVSIVVIYVFTTEQYPTVIRNVGIGACSICGKMGGISTPYINHSSTLWAPLPVLLLGSGALTAGLSTLLLPETSGEKLLESIEDGEQFGKRSTK